MGDLGASNVVVLSDNIDRVKAFVERVYVDGRLQIPLAPPGSKDRIWPESDDWDPPNMYDLDEDFGGPLLEPQITTLAKVREIAGHPPARLKWRSEDRVAAAILTDTNGSEGADYYKPSDLERIARFGFDGFSWRLQYVSATEFPDLTFLCTYCVTEGGWLVCWHLLKGGVIRHGGVFQRTNWRHARRYRQIVTRWMGEGHLVPEHGYKLIEDKEATPYDQYWGRKRRFDLLSPTANHGVVSF